MTAPPAPIAFGPCAGLLHDAPGALGVVLCGPWGYEALSACAGWRVLAERVAGAGLPCLRFEYPGTGDSLDPGEADGLDGWTASIVAAAEALRRASGVARIALVGQGLGATLAALAAPSIAGVEAVGLLAPVVDGGAHLRELRAWGRVIAGAAGLSPPSRTDAIEIAGFRLPPSIAEALGDLDLSSLTAAPAPRLLLAARPGREAEVRLAGRLRSLGAEVVTMDYAGYEAFVGDPTSSRPPSTVFETVAGWLEQVAAAPGPLRHGASTDPSRPCSLAADGFVERRARFSGPPGLFGVLCEPVSAAAASSVLFLNAGGDPHIGWARTTVDHARALARAGVASLRIDASGLGESPRPAQARGHPLYSDAHTADALAAIDWLASQGRAPVMVVGRCSGAFTGFAAAALDARVSDLVMINVRRFVWDPDESVEEAIATRTFDGYRARALQPQTIARLLRGQVAVGAAARRMAQRSARSATATLAGMLGGATKATALNAEVHDRFERLRDRGVRVSLLFSAGDEGLDQFAGYFGRDGRRLAAYPNVTLGVVEAADHNLTPAHARDWLLERLLQQAGARPPAQVGAA